MLQKKCKQFPLKISKKMAENHESLYMTQGHNSKTRVRFELTTLANRLTGPAGFRLFHFLQILNSHEWKNVK